MAKKSSITIYKPNLSVPDIDDGIDYSPEELANVEFMTFAREVRKRCGDRVCYGRLPKTVISPTGTFPDYFERQFWVANQRYCPVCGRNLIYNFSWGIQTGFGYCVCQLYLQHYWYLSEPRESPVVMIIGWAVAGYPEEPWIGEYEERFA